MIMMNKEIKMLLFFDVMFFIFVLVIMMGSVVYLFVDNFFYGLN